MIGTLAASNHSFPASARTYPQINSIVLAKVRRTEVATSSEHIMSDKAEKKPKEAAAEPAKEGAEPAAKKGPPVKLIGAVAVIMIAEGAGVYFLASATGPKDAHADVKHVEDEHAKNAEALVEIPLVEDKFQNMQSGRAYIWDMSIVIKVKGKDEELVTKTLERNAAEVKEGVALIVRRAAHTHLLEPGLESLNRQLVSYLNTVVEHDAEGKDRVQRVLIPKCKGFPAE